MTPAIRQPWLTDARIAPDSTTGWTLTGCLPGQSSLASIPVGKFPFVVGREASTDLCLGSRNVSKRHAEILATAGAVLVRDLGSTNGTFLNGRRINDPAPVDHGDLIQFADVELCLSRDSAQVAEHTQIAKSLEQSWLISRMNDVLHDGRLKMVFQPIMAGSVPTVIGYEALVRPDVPGLESPVKLFEAAVRLGLEERLGRRCRLEAVRAFERADPSFALFVNTHPHEALDGDLIDSLKDLRQEAGRRPLVLEIHEHAVPDILRIRDFCDTIRGLGVDVAFDDFGIGQSRLLELDEAPPAYLKFDRSLVKDLGSKSSVHTDLVRALHQHAIDLGIATVAEGLDNARAALACQQIGFTHFQGFLFGQPLPVDQILSSSSSRSE